MADTIARSAGQLGTAIRRARKSRALTQGRLGQLLNVRQATVSTLEKGARSTRLQTLLDALAALDLELVVRERTKGQLRDIEDIF
jgi:HTH-type transcriptional regulator/antitoxin HipB